MPPSHIWAVFKEVEGQVERKSNWLLGVEEYLDTQGGVNGMT